jgi:hypothetical protein
MFKSALFFLFLVVVCYAQQSQSYGDSDVDGNMEGSSGEMKLQWRARSWFRRRAGSCRVLYSHLQEFDKTGNPWTDFYTIVPEQDIDTKPWTWTRETPPSQYTFKGVANMSYAGGTQMAEVFVYIGPPKEINVTGRWMPVRNRELKFTWHLHSADEADPWVWNYGLNGELRFGMLVLCHESLEEMRAELANLNLRRALVQIYLGLKGMDPDADFDIAGRGIHRATRYITVDGVEQPWMNATRIKFLGLTEHVFLFIYHLPHFTYSLKYDPSTALSDGTRIGLVSGLVGAVVFVGICIGIGVCFVRRRRRLQAGMVIATHT